MAAPGNPKKEPITAPMAPPSPAHPAQEIGLARLTQRDCPETTTSPASRGGPSTSWVAQKVCSSSGDRKRGSGLPQGHTGRGVEESALIFVSRRSAPTQYRCRGPCQTAECT